MESYYSVLSVPNCGYSWIGTGRSDDVKAGGAPFLVLNPDATPGRRLFQPLDEAPDLYLEFAELDGTAESV